MSAMPPASPLSVGSLAQLSLSLLAIVALIFALSWAVKRFKLAATRGRGELAILDQISVGPRERVVLVRVGEAQVLLGVGAGGIVGLTPLAAPLLTRPNDGMPNSGGPGAGVSAFADRLREFMSRPGTGS